MARLWGAFQACQAYLPRELNFRKIALVWKAEWIGKGNARGGRQVERLAFALS